MLETVLFFSLAIVAIAAACAMIVHRSPVYSVLLLIVTLFSLAGLYVLLNATFIAAVHMIVYTGAIMVLFLFVIMLLDLREDIEKLNLRKMSRVLAIFAFVVFLAETFMLLSFELARADARIGLGGKAGQVGDTPAVGKLLFTKYLLPFEIASVLLLVAIIGATILAKRNLAPSQPRS